MGKPVSLEAIVSEVCGMMSPATIYLNPETGEVGFRFDDPDITGDEREATARFEEAPWCAVPFPEEDSDWRIMRHFTSAQESEEVREALWRVLNGPHPFRRFRSELRRRDLQDAWWAFHESELRDYVRSWLEVSKIPFTETKVPAS